jgi:hypothetical protein
LETYIVLWGDLEEDLVEQQGHNGVALDRFLERDDSRLMRYTFIDPTFGELEMVIEVGLMDLATFREPSTVAAEDCLRRHCSVERYQQDRARGERKGTRCEDLVEMRVGNNQPEVVSGDTAFI